MTLPSYLNFSNNIRTHAAFVGVILALDSIVTLLMRAAWSVKIEDLPKELQHIAYLKDVLLAVGIVNTLFTIMFWVGFLKRVRWCLTVFVGFMAVVITLQFIGLLGAMLQLNVISACVMLIVLAANAYVLLVTLQLRNSISNFTAPPDGFGV